MKKLKKVYLLALTFLISLSVGCNLFKKDFVPSECRPEFTVPVREPGVHYLEFMAVGDAGTGTDGQVTVARSMKIYAGKTPAEFVLYLGDNFYPHGVGSVDDPKFQTQFEEIYDKTVLNIPFYVVAGNHDYEGDVYAQVAYAARSSRWRMPNFYYTFTIKHNGKDFVQFFAIDTMPIIKRDKISDQLTWLIDELSRSKASWKIVFGHHPIFSNGLHGDSFTMKGWVFPILAMYDVDIYLCGHDHDLQILKPANESGVHFFVNGTGASYRDTRCRDNSIYAASRLGFMALRISQNEMVISVVLHEGIVDFCHVISK